jgi:hypothetical protein
MSKKGGWPFKSVDEAVAHQLRHGFLPPPLADQPEYREALAAASKEPKPKRRKKTVPEKEMELILERQKQAGEIISYRYEGWRMKWGENPKTGEAMWYKPDFVLFLPNARWPVKVIETKGPWISERDLVRFKGARAAWPEILFEMWQRDKEGRWTRLH